MTGTTPTEGYPYPLTSDFADVQDAYRLATAIDTDLRAEQAPFRAFMGRPSFIGRQTVTPGSGQSGTWIMQMNAVDWDNTGGVTAGSYTWYQPIGQAPSWWLFGCTLLVNFVSGTQTVGDMNLGRIELDTTDQVSGVVTANYFYQRNDDTGTSGEWVNLFAMAPMYRGNAQAALILNSSTAQRTLGPGSRFWGMYLGPVT